MKVLHKNKIKHQQQYRYLRVPTCAVQISISGVLPDPISLIFGTDDRILVTIHGIRKV
jgi:hypothetical protein